MKKLTSGFLAFLMIFQLSMIPAYAETQYPTVKINIYTMQGATIADVVIIDGTMMIDLSNLSFYIGASPIRSAGRDGLKINNHTVTVESGTNKAYVDGTQMTMPVSSFVQNGRTYVPLDFIVQSSGLMLYWREQTEALYIQSPNNYQQALDIVTKSAEAVKNKNYVTTTFSDYVNLSSDQPERYFVESIGTMSTDMKNNISQDQHTSTLYNGYYDSIQHTREQTYVSKDPLDAWNSLKYITANGIYSLNDRGTYDKEPVPPENISAMDMANKSVQTDLNLFLYSASVSKNYNGVITLKAHTDVGILMKVGFDIYMPTETGSLQWKPSYQTIQYDSQTYLPKNMELSLHASYQYGGGQNQKAYLSHYHTYAFDFNKGVQINLPDGVE